MNKDETLRAELTPQGIQVHMAVAPAVVAITYPPGQFRCDCGESYDYDVKTQGYPKWHAAHKYVEECAGKDCGKRCCHACAVTCQVCGCHYCPAHQGGFYKPLSLCEDCGAYYTTFDGHADPGDVQKLLVIERRLATNAGYGRAYILDSERDWLIESLKEAWEELAEHFRKATRGL